MRRFRHLLELVWEVMLLCFGQVLWSGKRCQSCSEWLPTFTWLLVLQDHQISRNDFGVTGPWHSCVWLRRAGGDNTDSLNWRRNLIKRAEIIQSFHQRTPPSLWFSQWIHTLWRSPFFCASITHWECIWFYSLPPKVFSWGHGIEMKSDLFPTLQKRDTDRIMSRDQDRTRCRWHRESMT